MPDDAVPLEQLRVRALAAIVEDGAVADARAAAAGRVAAPTAEVGALLALLATTLGARTVVEVGSAAGVSGLWTLSGMVEGGTLTSVEHDRDVHELAAAAFTAAGLGSRVRAIVGDPTVVLPRLADGAYDLVVVQTPVPMLVDAVDHGRRLLRPGGMLVVRRALVDDDRAGSLAEVQARLAADDALATTTLPLDDGLVVATRRPIDPPGQHQPVSSGRSAAGQ